MGNFDRGQRGGGGRSFGRRDQGGGRFDRPREMHKVTCSECGKETEVPFKPTGDRPVYCRECFAKQGGDQERRSFGGDNRDSRPPFKKFEDNRSQTPSNTQLDAINSKLDQLIKLLSPKVEKTAPAPEEKKFAALVTAAKKEKKEIVGKTRSASSPRSNSGQAGREKRVVKKVSETPTETPEE